jgi:hypothetical protein
MQSSSLQKIALRWQTGDNFIRPGKTYRGFFYCLKCLFVIDLFRCVLFLTIFQNGFKFYMTTASGREMKSVKYVPKVVVSRLDAAAGP